MGPRSTSIWSTRNGSTDTAWSWLSEETSATAMLLLRTPTRVPCSPRITGRPTFSPKLALAMPGVRARGLAQ